MSDTAIQIYIDRSIRLPVPEISLAQYLEKASDNRQPITLTDELAQAAFCLLPYSWEKYAQAGLARQVIDLAAQWPDKYFIIFAQHDFEAIIPIPNAVQFQNGLYRSGKRTPAFAFELPAFWPDYLEIYCKGQMQYRTKQARPRIGFCGQAISQPHKIAYWSLKNMGHTLAHQFGRAAYRPPPIQPAVVLRNRVLKTLTASPQLDTHFIIRNQYRAGLKNKAERADHFHPTKVEFVNNILDNDYTVCVRGGGNFSVRFYETLCCGRIPIFVDTDCRLPYDFRLDWKKYCVWIEYAEIPHMAEKVLDFHASLSPDDFIELQNACRQVWAEWLVHEAFLRHFGEHLHYILG